MYQECFYLYCNNIEKYVMSYCLSISYFVKLSIYILITDIPRNYHITYLLETFDQIINCSITFLIHHQ